MTCPKCLETQILLSLLIINPFPVCLFFQIGAYDQQIWEKSVEQREIKVRLVHFFCCLHTSHVSVFFHCCFPVCVFFLCSAYFKRLSSSSISFWLPLLFFFFILFSLSLTMLPVLFQCFSFNSFLSALLAGCHLPPSLLSSSPPLLLHPSFPPPLYSLFLWWVYSGGGRPPSCCPTVHVLLTHAVDC